MIDTDVFVGVLAALVAYRALAWVGVTAIRAWVAHDRATSLARRHSWSGGSSRAWRTMQWFGVSEPRVR